MALIFGSILYYVLLLLNGYVGDVSKHVGACSIGCLT
jgi:hypothetical protein